jgi:hypothetical protein
MALSTLGRMMTPYLKETMSKVFLMDISAISTLLETWSFLDASFGELWSGSVGGVFQAGAF